VGIKDQQVVFLVMVQMVQFMSTKWNQDQLYRMNAGVRPRAGARFQYGPPGM
jgi:hypothetical protein